MISYIKCRVMVEKIHLLYDAIQYFMKKYQVPNSMTISVLATDFNQSVIVRNNSIQPWTTGAGALPRSLLAETA